MACVQLRNGDTLKVYCFNTQNTPFGLHNIEFNFQLDYEEILTKLSIKKSPKPKTQGAQTSKVIGLLITALYRGKWSTGKKIDREEILKKLMDCLYSLNVIDYANITKKAKASLQELYMTGKLTCHQKKELREAISVFN